MALWEFEAVAGPFTFTEGPVWDGRIVRFTDIRAARIMAYDPASGTCEPWAVDSGEANGLALDGQRRLVACEGGAERGGRRITRYEPDGSRTSLVERFEGTRLNSPNDVVVDSRGRVWFTDPRYGDRASMELSHESVYRLDPQADGSFSITRVTYDTARPNGLVFSPDERTLYVAESPPAPEGSRQLRAYPVQDDGSLGAYRVVHDFGPHRGIDGMRIDADGNVVAACGWDTSGPGPRIGIFAPDGTVLGGYPVPTSPTNVCFAEADLQTLYVTGYDGRLYRASTDRRGFTRG